MDKAWRWVDDLKVEVTHGSETTTYQLIPSDPARLEALRHELSIARQVAVTLNEAYTTFKEGRAEYEGAARKLKDIFTEWTDASRTQLQIALGISVFLLPSTIGQDLGFNVNVLTEFAGEAIERLQMAAVKAAAPKAEPAPEPVAVAAEGTPEG